jgi:hypothetical protein
VLKRVLSGFDFAMIDKSRMVEVIVYGESGMKATLPPR